jgi:hypothetical protein
MTWPIFSGTDTLLKLISCDNPWESGRVSGTGILLKYKQIKQIILTGPVLIYIDPEFITIDIPKNAET